MRIVLVEDHALLRDVFVAALQTRGVTVAEHVVDLAGARDAVRRHRPDLLVLDIRLPPTYTDEGIRIAESIRRTDPDLALLVLSSFAEVTFVERLLSIDERSRALGYLLKDRVTDLTYLVDAMKRVTSGEVIVDSHLIDRLMAGRNRIDPLDRLTPAERRILGLVAEGRSNHGIAAEVGCRPGTVEKHLTVITEKLGLPGIDDASRRGVNVRVLATLEYLRRTADVPDFPTLG